MTLTFEFHANFETFLESAEWTPFPLCFVDVTRSLGDARVHLFILYGPLEKAFARFARE